MSAGLYSQFFVLSLRGDVLLFRDCTLSLSSVLCPLPLPVLSVCGGAVRGELVKATTQIFFRYVKAAAAETSLRECPVFAHDGVHYLHVLDGGMYFVFTTRVNVSPGQALELLHRLCELLRDFCGVLSEEGVRKNFVLAYELVDEVLDLGYPQCSAVEELKAFVRSAPVLVDTETRSGLSALVASRTTSSKTANQSVAGDRKALADEIFVDLLESCSVILAPSGTVLHQEVEGALVIKSFVKGHPKIKLGLNEDLRVGRGAPGTGPPSACVLDQATFHACASFTEWDMDRTLSFYPPEGEFHLLRYRTTDAFAPPFRVFVHVDEPGPEQLDLLVKLAAEFAEPNVANRVIVAVRVPRAVASCSCELSDAQHSYEWLPAERRVLWGAKRWSGGAEASLRIKLNLDGKRAGKARRELGPVALRFELPMFVCSNVQIRYLKVFDNDKMLSPHRWVRSITRADAYECRVAHEAPNRPW